MTLIVGGLALGGLLYYGWQTGQDLPVLPAIAVVLVNIVGAGKLVYDAKRKQDMQARAQAKDGANKEAAKAGRTSR
jgi:hypothetical protein